MSVRVSVVQGMDEDDGEEGKRGNPGRFSRLVWSDEDTFKLNGTINRHNCVYWANENPHIFQEKAVNFPGLTVWYALSSRGIIGPYFFEGTVTGEKYLQMLETTIPRLNDLFDNENGFYFQQDGAPAHFHVNVKNFLDRTLNQRWIERRESPAAFPPRFSDLTPPDFCLWGALKNTVYATNTGGTETLFRLDHLARQFRLTMCDFVKCEVIEKEDVTRKKQKLQAGRQAGRQAKALACRSGVTVGRGFDSRLGWLSDDLAMDDEETESKDEKGFSILSEEFELALKEMKNGKVTGVDGIPTELVNAWVKTTS
ncbi:hypothetical protein ANN_21384 [Periplaneta americana]|uniref:Uncharacterized protein n=1 Tax=Periplaneta americana TaxID=6978 RepID=A0ABQ8SF48_PERAM|nr:hypothetical protein ANN_21384 [Periplaneta americana]